MYAFLLFAEIANTALDGDLGESDILYLSEGVLFIPVKLYFTLPDIRGYYENISIKTSLLFDS